MILNLSTLPSFLFFLLALLFSAGLNSPQVVGVSEETFLLGLKVLGFPSVSFSPDSVCQSSLNQRFKFRPALVFLTAISPVFYANLSALR